MIPLLITLAVIIAASLYVSYKEATKPKIKLASEYIGKQYRPIDNSYAMCISDSRYNAERYHYLAGMDGGNYPATICTIISNPFTMPIITNHSKDKKEEFIMVRDPKGNTHITLFFEHAVIDSKEYIKWNSYMDTVYP